jgi:hypothetical protein
LDFQAKAGKAKRVPTTRITAAEMELVARGPAASTGPTVKDIQTPVIARIVRHTVADRETAPPAAPAVAAPPSRSLPKVLLAILVFGICGVLAGAAMTSLSKPADNANANVATANEEVSAAALAATAEAIATPAALAIPVAIDNAQASRPQTTTANVSVKAPLASTPVALPETQEAAGEGSPVKAAPSLPPPPKPEGIAASTVASNHANHPSAHRVPTRHPAPHAKPGVKKAPPARHPARKHPAPSRRPHR